MAWDFQTDPEFQKQLDWADNFLREEVEPLDMLFWGQKSVQYDTKNKLVTKLIKPLQAKVKAQGLWAAHLTPELGGMGWGQVKLALLNEILGRSTFAPRIFGCQAPDTGNAELLAHFANDEQKKKYLQPLLDGDIVSCFSMTEPQGGADPKVFKCLATRVGDEYVIEGEKWFSSNSRYAEFLLVVTVTDPNVPIHRGATIILVPANTPGLETIRDVGTGGEPLGHGSHGYLRFNKVRVPVSNRIGNEGEGFKAAQVRLGGGRIHHGMRVVAETKKAFDMLCERAISRFTQGTKLSEKQMVQEMIADSHIEWTQFRLHVLHTAWLIDKYNDYNHEVRREIGAVKASMAKLMHDIIWRAMHIHGSLGMTNEMPLTSMWEHVGTLATVDGPTEVHKVTVAKEILRDRKPAEGLFPTAHLPPRIEAARKKFAAQITDDLKHYLANHG